MCKFKFGVNAIVKWFPDAVLYVEVSVSPSLNYTTYDLSLVWCESIRQLNIPDTCYTEGRTIS